MKKFADLKKNRGFSEFNANFVGGKYLKFFIIYKLPWGHMKSHTKLGPIGSAVLAFIGYKQTDKQSL